MSTNLVTGREFEPLHREYQTFVVERTETIIVRWYDSNNEFHEHVTNSRMLAERMAADYNGTYTVR